MKPKIREVAESEGIKNALELSKRSGVPYASIYGLWNGTAKMVAFETLDRLCTALGVRPGQLFDFVPEPDKLPGGDEGEQVQRRPSPVRAGKGESRKAKTSAALAIG